jgi:prolyl-tRNA editing enzyme YbaK/EbsC (Cys-tRNA(Pro) deacylase)
MPVALSEKARRVQEALDAFGLLTTVVELPQSTHSAQEAAQAIGCALGQIAKSIVFHGQNSGRPFLVIASGENRVHEPCVSTVFAEPLSKASADYVRRITGYAIGGVPPVGHNEHLLTLVDEDLLAYPQIWAAAGTANAVFSLMPTDLVRITGGQVTRIKA